MTDRWWAPGSQMTLEPLGDPERDLVTAFMSVHRDGAAACNGGGADIAEFLVGMRQAVAVDHVVRVSKSVDSPTYAGLLVRDWYDDAEAGAMQVFDAATARGVAASTAAERAGLVYGVPPRLLGSYVALAAVQGTPVPKLTEVADALLWQTAQEYAAAERDEVSKTISDAYKDEPRRPKGPGGGRFTEREVGSQVQRNYLEERLADVAPEEPVVQRPKKRESVVERRQNKAKAKGTVVGRRTARTAKITEREAAPVEQRAIVQRSSRRASKRREKVLDRSSLVTPRDPARSTAKPKAAADTGVERLYTNLKDRSPVAVVLSPQDFAEVLRRRTFDGTGDIVSVAHLTEHDGRTARVTRPATQEDAHEALIGDTTFRHMDRLATAASAEDSSAARPEVQIITDRELGTSTPAKDDPVLRKAKEDAVLQTLADEHLRLRPGKHMLEGEINSVRHVRLAEGDGFALIYLPNSTAVVPDDPDHTMPQYVMPAADVVVIRDHILRGRQNVGGELRLDPNQTLRFDTVKDDRGHVVREQHEVYDSEHGALVRTHFMTTDPYDEIGKANEHWRVQPRDHGEFASEAERPVVNLPPVAPEERATPKRRESVVERRMNRANGRKQRESVVGRRQNKQLARPIAAREERVQAQRASTRASSKRMPARAARRLSRVMNDAVVTDTPDNGFRLHFDDYMSLLSPDASEKLYDAVLNNYNDEADFGFVPLDDEAVKHLPHDLVGGKQGTELLAALPLYTDQLVHKHRRNVKPGPVLKVDTEQHDAVDVLGMESVQHFQRHYDAVRGDVHTVHDPELGRDVYKVTTHEMDNSRLHPLVLIVHDEDGDGPPGLQLQWEGSWLDMPRNFDPFQSENGDVDLYGISNPSIMVLKLTEPRIDPDNILPGRDDRPPFPR